MTPTPFLIGFPCMVTPGINSFEFNSATSFTPLYYPNMIMNFASTPLGNESNGEILFPRIDAPRYEMPMQAFKQYSGQSVNFIPLLVSPKETDLIFNESSYS